MKVSFMDIVNARLDAVAYERVTQAVEARYRGRMPAIMDEVCLRRGVTREQIKNKARGPKAWSDARQEFMLEAHRAGFSMPQIGRFIGRDHSSVHHGIHAAAKREAQQ